MGRPASKFRPSRADVRDHRAARLPILLFCGVFIGGPTWADATESSFLRSKPALLRMSDEVLDIGPSETVGLAGRALLRHGAYAGDAGGYAVGLIGAGWGIPLHEDGRLSFNAELVAGTAGGGGAHHPATARFDLAAQTPVRSPSGSGQGKSPGWKTGQ